MYNDRINKYQRLGKEEPMTLKGGIVATLGFLTLVALCFLTSN